MKVVRVQYVFDVRNEKKFAAQSKEELGCGRSFSHAQGKTCRPLVAPLCTQTVLVMTVHRTTMSRTGTDWVTGDRLT